MTKTRHFPKKNTADDFHHKLSTKIEKTVWENELENWKQQRLTGEQLITWLYKLRISRRGRFAVITCIHAFHEVLYLDGGSLDFVLVSQDVVGSPQNLLRVTVFLYFHIKQISSNSLLCWSFNKQFKLPVAKWTEREIFSMVKHQMWRLWTLATLGMSHKSRTTSSYLIFPGRAI